MADWFPKPDREAEAASNRIITALEADEALYGLTAADTARLRAEQTAFAGQLNSADAAKAAQNTAVANKDASRKTLEEDLRPVVQRVQVQPGVTDEMRTAAGIPIRDTTRTVNSPIVPRDLVARATPDGGVELKFNGNGNTSGAQFRIEVKRGLTGAWELAEVATTTRVMLKDFTPGVRCDFRVMAKRGNELSAASNVASIYVT